MASKKPDDDDDVPGEDELDPEAPGDDDGDGEDDGEEDRITHVDQLAQRVARLEKWLRPGRGTPAARGGQAQEAEERRAELREELTRLRAQERKDREFAAMQAGLKKLEKVVTEAPPREWRRVEKILGWVRD